MLRVQRSPAERAVRQRLRRRELVSTVIEQCYISRQRPQADGSFLCARGGRTSASLVAQGGRAGTHLLSLTLTAGLVLQSIS